MSTQTIDHARASGACIPAGLAAHRAPGRAIEAVLLISAVAIGVGAHGGVDVNGQALLIIGFAVVGLVVSVARPREPMGWLMLGVTGLLLLDAVGATYSVLDYSRHGGHLPLGPLAVLIEPSWAPAITMLVFSILLYPDGRLPSPRWRWPVRWLGAPGNSAAARRVHDRGQCHHDRTYPTHR
jgi:hypothetical protein